MDKLLFGLALALLSLITFLAFKHPKNYALIHPVLKVFVVAGLLFALGMDTGAGAHFKALLPVMDPTGISEAENISRDLTFSIWIYLFIGLAGAYLSFLRALPRLLEKQ